MQLRLSFMKNDRARRMLNTRKPNIPKKNSRENSKNREDKIIKYLFDTNHIASRYCTISMTCLRTEKEKIYSRQSSAPILKRKSSRFGLGQLLGSTPPNNSIQGSVVLLALAIADCRMCIG